MRASNLLGFAPTLDLKQSIVPGFVTLLGTGKFLASSNGPVIFVEPPFRADPEALLGWADCPSPSIHHDGAWMAASLAGVLQGAFGRASGEERQYDFTGAAPSCCRARRCCARTPPCCGSWSSRPSS